MLQAMSAHNTSSPVDSDNAQQCHIEDRKDPEVCTRLPAAAHLDKYALS